MTAGEILARRAAVQRELAALEEQLALALRDREKPEPVADEVLTLAEAAAHVHEPISTFRRRLSYRAATVSAAS